MGWDGNVLTAPFTKIAANGSGDLQQALGTSVMNQIALCTHANINPLSYHKPTAYEGITGGGSTEQAEYTDGLDPDRTAWSINKGTAFLPDSSYSTSDANTLKLLSNPYGVPTDKWTLIKPTVVYRAMDFDGYIPTGKLVYPLTCYGFPYDVVLDYSLSRSGTYALRPSFRILLRYSMNDAYGEALPRNAHLLGLKNLINERNTSYTNLDVRLGFYVYAEAKPSYGRNDGLTFMFINSSDHNLANSALREKGWDSTEIMASSAIVATTTTQASTKILLGETVSIVPFVAKRYTFNSLTGWYMYSLCAATSMKWNVDFDERAMGGGIRYNTSSSYPTITYTAQVLSDGRIGFYINQASDFFLRFNDSTAPAEMFSPNPITVGATGSHVQACTPAVITLGTQIFTGGFWSFPRTASVNMSINATSINGWSTSTAALNRAGTFYIRRSDVSGAITVNACINACQTYPCYLTGTIPANIQTGGTFTLTYVIS